VTRAHSIRGFSLIEIMAAMLIIALVASLAVTLMPASGRARVKAAAMETAALIRRERIGAILTGRDRQVVIDGEQRALIGDGGDRVVIPADVVLDLLGTSALAARQTVVRFRPDGASSGAVLRLSRERIQYEIKVNWYTGGVTITAL